MYLSSKVKADRILDCIGLYCPVPVFRTKEEIDKLSVGQILEVIADDPAAEEDIKYWAKNAGQEILDVKVENGKIRFLIRKLR